MRVDYQHFSEWLGEQTGYAVAARKVNTFLAFFAEVEEIWGGFPDYSRLVTEFGAEKLRKVRLPMRWLQETGRLAVDAQTRDDVSEQRRIDAILTQYPDNAAAQDLLDEYRAYLFLPVKNGQRRLRTIRLYLHAASDVLRGIRVPFESSEFARSLETYLFENPGQRNSIQQFLTFLHSEYDFETGLPEENGESWRKYRDHTLKKEILSLIREAPPGGFATTDWYSVALSYFHGLPRSVGRRLPKEKVREEQGGFSILLSGRTYWIPDPTKAGPDGQDLRI
jgi:hypothetical protein